MPNLNRAIRNLPPTVLLLGLVSFLNDFSSEMIYPLLPVFLTSVLGASAINLGIIEGAAEFVASILKVVSGTWADRIPKRKPLVVAGYGVSNLVRPLIGLATAWPWVFALRVTDRVGKGVRTSPRDALIADVTDEKSRGMAFGVQRALDHAGAVAGPLVAMGLMYLFIQHLNIPQDRALRYVFLLSVIPALAVVVVVVFFLKECTTCRADSKVLKLVQRWRELGHGFHMVLLAIFVFTLGNSTDAFLILKLSNAGVQPEWLAGLWAIHHAVKMSSATLGGWMSDRVGRRPMVVAGWLYYAAIYFAFAYAQTTAALITIFILYGIFYGLTEPSEKAWVADLAPKALRGEAFGWYNGAVGIGALPASILFGAIWMKFGPHMAFITGAGFAFIASILLFAVPSPKQK
jgi:MFS family permease